MKPRSHFLALAIAASLATVAGVGAQEPPAGTQPPPASGTQPPPAEATPPAATTTPPATTPTPAEATPPAATTQPAPAAAAETPAAITPESRIDAVKQSLATSEGVLKQYEWSQKVALSVKGEEKARKDYKCSYGADGKVQKTAAAPAEEKKKKKGIRGKIAANKTEDMEAALKASMALIDQYSPLEAGRVQTAKSTGNVSVSVPGADNRVRITIKNYLKPGDVVELEVDGAKNTLQSVSITSAMDQADVKGPVAAKVTYAAMADGTLYPAHQVLDLKAQSLKIDVENSGYTKKAS